MITVGVRELKQRASELLRLVRVKDEIVEITYHGEPIARLVPVQPPTTVAEDTATWWSDLDQLTAEISARWPAGISAAEAVKEGRREL